MRKLLNTLYVTTQTAYLSLDGETVLVRVEKEVKLRVPLHTLDGIVAFGVVSCSPWLMGACAERDVSISFLTEHGHFLASVRGPVSGNVLLRREQYRRADDEAQSAQIARSVVLAKVANCRAVLLRAARDNAPPESRQPLEDAAIRLAQVLDGLREGTPLDSVRGYEGDAGRSYFSVFDHLVQCQKEDFRFVERSRRPPLDNINALLSFVYTLLVHDVRSALETVGLDPAVGYLHRDRPGRPGLALDLMEEFRPVLADRLALTLVNRRQVQGTGFRRSETGAVVMDEATRKEVLVAWQKRKQDEIQHPFLGVKMPLGLVPWVQAMLLARHLRGDLDAYPPFFWK